MNKLLIITQELKKIAGKRHKQRYGPKEMSQSQIIKKFKIAMQAIGDLLTIPEENLNNFLDFKQDLNVIYERISEMYKKISNY